MILSTRDLLAPAHLVLCKYTRRFLAHFHGENDILQIYALSDTLLTAATGKLNPSRIDDFLALFYPNRTKMPLYRYSATSASTSLDLLDLYYFMPVLRTRVKLESSG